MSKIGVLQEVTDGNVRIDDVWYDGSAIKQYIPSTTGIQVEYNHDDNNVLAFIRNKAGYDGGSGGFKKKTAYTPKNTGGNDTRTNSIIRQVIFKVAGNLVSGVQFASIEDALAAFDETYQKLEKVYLPILKS